MSLIKANRHQLGISATATQNFTLTAEAADGTCKLARGNAGATTQDVLTVDASGNVNAPVALQQAGTAVSRMVLSTAQNTTSGTAIDFTGIPSWAKRITVTLNGVSKNATGSLLLQLGTASGVETTGYSSAGTNFVGNVTSTAGFIVADGTAAWLTIGTFTLVNMGSNLWICTHSCSLGSVSGTFFLGSGSKTLSAVLDRVRITTSTGTDTFDAGSVNILYEG